MLLKKLWMEIALSGDCFAFVKAGKSPRSKMSIMTCKCMCLYVCAHAWAHVSVGIHGDVGLMLMHICLYACGCLKLILGVFLQ